MDAATAIGAFAALAQETRLGVIRLLAECGPAGLTAGDLAERLSVPPSTLSHHLATLERAGLAHSRRVHRQIFYAADRDGAAGLLGFLARTCGERWDEAGVRTAG